MRRVLFTGAVLTVLLLLHALPWWRLVLSPAWPAPVTAVATALAVLIVVAFPFAMVAGHGRRHVDGLAVVADVWLGIVWQLFAWTLIGELVRLGLLIAGVPDPTRSRLLAVGILAVVVALSGWGATQALGDPRITRLDVHLDRLGVGLDGARVVVIADTHFGPIDRRRWSSRLAAAVNALDADIVAHVGDLADGSVAQRSEQVAPLAGVRARLTRVYITGNHEYFSGAAQWVEHMAGLGWTVLHNRHVVVERGDDRLVVAGVDDLTAAGSGVPGHAADLAAALRGSDPALPVLLLSHQPKSVRLAVAAGVDLQLSGHTHGGQIFPFHLLVRADQGVLAGLTRPGPRTQLYTSRGSGFWGPPFRVFAPSELTVLTLRSGTGRTMRAGRRVASGRRSEMTPASSEEPR